jgi:hypothetical protein
MHHSLILIVVLILLLFSPLGVSLAPDALLSAICSFRVVNFQFVNRVTKLLGIEHPIIQGGMHYVGYASMAAAVSEAGGLGMITALTLPTPELLRAEIRAARALTKKPFGVNVTLLPALQPPNYDAYR